MAADQLRKAIVNAADRAAVAHLLARGLDEGDIIRRFAVVRPDLDRAVIKAEIEALGGATPRTPERDVRPALADFSLLVTADSPTTPVSSESALLVQDFSGIEDLRAGLADLGWTDAEIAEIVTYCEHVRSSRSTFANAWQHDDLARQITTTRGLAIDRGWPYSSEEIAEVARRIGPRFYEGPLTALNERLDPTGFNLEFAHWGGEGSSSRVLFIGDGTTPSRFGDDRSDSGQAS